MATDAQNKSLTQVIYGLYAAGFVTGGLTSIAAIIMNYVKRRDVAGTPYEAHFRWQMRTFWFGVLFTVIGYVTVFILIGFLILFATVIWTIYRIVVGWLRLNEDKPIENPEAFF